MANQEKQKQVAALKYNKDQDNAPKIVALGKRETADKILEIAKKSNVPVYENAPLAESLNKLMIGQEIPSELYEIVAQVLVFVAELDVKRTKR